MRIPKIQSMKTAVSIYYQYPCLGNEEIQRLFGDICKAKIAELKKLAKTEMLKSGCPVYNPRLVSTPVAYKAWGVDIDDLVSRLETMQKLGIKEAG